MFGLAPWQQQASSVESIDASDAANLLPELEKLLENRTTPLILKGLCQAWPLVRAGLQSDAAAADYLLQYYQGEPVSVCHLAPEAMGRVFYNADFSGFNYQAGKMALPQLLQQLQRTSAQTAAGTPAATWYMGSTEVNRWFAGLAVDNSLVAQLPQSLTSVWLGNQARIAAHFDFPHNLACNVVGHRTFTLFPPEQIANLYPGPMEFAPGGQDISLVDFLAPDFEQFPRFAQAQQAALIAALQPGDVLFIPSMWWHHVQGHDALNVLISHWWRDSPAYLGRPTNALLHSMLSLRSLPKAQRQAWQALFNYYIFDHDEVAEPPLPDAAKGMLTKPLDELNARQLRADLQNKLKR
jgi:hypothetical protein